MFRSLDYAACMVGENHLAPIPFIWEGDTHNLFTADALGVEHLNHHTVAGGDAAGHAHHLGIGNTACMVSPLPDCIGPCAEMPKAVIGHNPGIMVLREHQLAPCLIHSPLVGEWRPCAFKHGKFLSHDHLVLGCTHAAPDALHNLAAPHEVHQHIVLRKVVVVGGSPRRMLFDIISPKCIDRTRRMVHFQPRAVAPSCILIAHPHRVVNPGFTAGREIFRRVAPGRCLPHGIVFKLLATVAWHSEQRCSVRPYPVHELAAVGRHIPAPACVGAFQ